MAGSRLRVVICVAVYTKHISYYDDWMDAFCKSDLFEAEVINIMAPGAYDDLKRKQREADGIILLHSTNGDTLEYMVPLVGLLSERKCPLLSFVGNEFNFPGAYISEKRDLFKKFEPDFIATQLLQEAGSFLFSDVVKQKVYSVPHALNSDVFQFKTAHKDRVWDLGGVLLPIFPILVIVNVTSCMIFSVLIALILTLKLTSVMIGLIGQAGPTILIAVGARFPARRDLGIWNAMIVQLKRLKNGSRQ